MTGLCALMGAEQSTKERPNSARAQAVENIQLIRSANNILIDPSATVAIVEPVV